MKLKLGKDEPTPSKDNSSGTSSKPPEIKEPPKPAAQSEKKPEPERKIIKFDTPEKKKEEATIQQQKKPEIVKITTDKPPGASADAAREELEQRRNILQNMKDFDFQIKKNQEEITNIVEKVENLSKDLDDLVSLYEIVSEQMNPFVGLSKVTKKRLDALENFTKEVDAVKVRIGDIESIIEKTGTIKTGGATPTPVKPTANPEIKPQTPLALNQPPSLGLSVPVAIQPTTEKITERDVDDLIMRSLESLLMEQNIDTMINEYFINLK